MVFRTYNKERDLKAIERIWIECGWIDDEDKEKKALEIFTSTSNCQVAEYNGSAESLIVLSPGNMLFGNRNLSLAAVSAVTVSRVLRKQGAALKLLASMIRNEIAKGTALTGLGMFEQGFYNRLGFATMGYEHWYSFDPSKIKVFKKGGIPVRLNTEDYKKAWKCYREAKKYHGFVTLDPPELFQSEMIWTKKGFGLGYETNGELSHYMWFSVDDAEDGPYTVQWMAFQNWDQFLELMGILKNLEEQVRTVRMKEPAFIQLQDLINKPFQLQTITRKSKFESRMRAIAYQQLRICNLESCIEAVEYEGKEFSFNLSLTDPINDYLDDKKRIDACEGQFIVNIGKSSNVSRGNDKNLPEVKGTVNGFTRMWTGILPAETVGLVEDITIDDSLIVNLTKAFYKPDVRSDWDY